MTVFDIGERLIVVTFDYLVFHFSISLTLYGFALGFLGNMNLHVERLLVQ